MAWHGVTPGDLEGAVARYLGCATGRVSVDWGSTTLVVSVEKPWVLPGLRNVVANIVGWEQDVEVREVEPT